MVLKNMMNSLLTFAVFVTAVLVGEKSNASMFGSGYYGGTQQCAYPTKVGKNAISMSDEEKEERKKVAALKRDLKLRKIEKHFDSTVAEFLMGVHIEKLNKCEDYKSHPNFNCYANVEKGSTSSQEGDASGNPQSSVISSQCGEKDDVPDLLKKSWIKSAAAGGGGYCSANSDSAKGSVNVSICTDKSLRPTDGSKFKTYSTTECSKALKDYRKWRIEQGNAQAKFERNEEEIREREYAISDARERAKLDREYNQRTQLEGECEDCDEESRGYKYEKPKRDWLGISAQVGMGLGLGYLGKRYDDRNAEYQAQLGYPPTQGYPTAVSLGLPFILGGVYGAVNGGTGSGGFGCGGNAYGGGGANGVYGPYGSAGAGGAFGYPQGMFGSPWGGGLFNPGIGANGGFNGPYGGFPGGMNGQFGIGAPINGGMGGGYPGMGGYP